MPKTTMLPLAALVLDPRHQPRAKIDPAVVAAYAEDLKRDCEFPTVVVYHDGSVYRLADGYHRVEAHRQAGRSHIACEVRSGGLREARLHAAAANASHGLRRSNEDKRRAVLMVLEDDECAEWSSAKVAKHCHVSEPLVQGIRRRLAEVAAAAEEQARLEAEKAAAEPGAESADAEAATSASVEEEEAEDDLGIGGGDVADEEPEVDEDKVRVQVWRSIRKLDRHAALLGSTTEQLLVDFRAGLIVGPPKEEE